MAAVGNVATQTIGAVGAALPGIAITPSSGGASGSGTGTGTGGAAGVGTLLSPVTSLVTTLAGVVPHK